MLSLKCEKSIFYILLLLLIYSSCSKDKSENLNPTNKTENDSIKKWIEKSKDSKLTSEQSLNFLSKALIKSKTIKYDSLKASYFSMLSNSYSLKKDSINFRYSNKESVTLNIKQSDSLAIANSYWDLAIFFNSYSVQDSAYFAFSEAQKVFEGIDEIILSGQMLLQMAKIQLRIKDYVGSETTATKAIERFKPLNDHFQLFDSYNVIGIAMGALGETEKSLVYYNEALFYLKLEPFEIYQEARIINNIGIVYRNNKQYKKAIENFSKVLNINNIERNRPDLYAIAASNFATAKLYNKDTLGIDKFFIKAINLKIQENKIASLAGTYFNYAQYKAYAKDTMNALSFAHKAEDLSIKTNNNEILLQTWAYLSELDDSKASVYAKNYIKLNDSLQKEERKQQNKFARIRFETDEVNAENVELVSEKEVLSKQKQMWTGIAAVFFLLGISIYIIINQRAKYQKLRFDQQQQANNQEIFNLMLMQKQKVDEVKRMEQKRISEELHDGILGKMLGARMVLTGLNKRATEEAIQEKSKALGSLQEIEREIRSISHELSHTAYQKINNFTDSIESLLSNINKNAKLDTIFKYSEDESWDSLAGDIKINVYRIIQESLQNAIKHANCTVFNITFHRTDDQFSIIMNDNGMGFNNNKGKKGIGIRNITSRVNKLKGSMHIDSVEGKGTTITLKIPISKIMENTIDNIS